MSAEKYSMLQVGCPSDRGPEWFVIYPKGGSYFKDELCRLPAGSEVNEIAAQKVLDAMNG